MQKGYFNLFGFMMVCAVLPLQAGAGMRIAKQLYGMTQDEAMVDRVRQNLPEGVAKMLPAKKPVRIPKTLPPAKNIDKEYRGFLGTMPSKKPQVSSSWGALSSQPVGTNYTSTEFSATAPIVDTASSGSKKPTAGLGDVFGAQEQKPGVVGRSFSSDERLPGLQDLLSNQERKPGIVSRYDIIVNDDNLALVEARDEFVTFMQDPAISNKDKVSELKDFIAVSTLALEDPNLAEKAQKLIEGAQREIDRLEAGNSDS